MGYIQTALAKVKKADLGEIRNLHKRGHKAIRFKLEEARNGKRKPATALVPLLWIIESRERHEVVQDDAVFNDFVSDWISGWA